MKIKTLAYSYIRFSSPQQAAGDTLRRQTELRNAWLDRSGATLDTALTLEDHGVSGFTGQHRDNPDRHALAAFVALVKAGRIARGSYLIVENLDRLSREDIVPALALLLDLIQAGIRVVQLLPVEAVYDAKSNPMQLMMAIMELSRGHSESAMKSERVGRAWQDKKRRAAENGEPLTARAPAWLRLVNGKWEVIEQAAQTIRRIFRLATDGYGLGVITKKLNAEGVPVVGHADHWARSYVAKLLTNRAVVGEYQPYKGRAAKRQTDGEPIADYYPTIVTEPEWYAARASIAGRKGKVGRVAGDRVNVFAGLLHDALNGGSLQQTNKGQKTSGRQLVSYKATQGVDGAKYVSFPVATFEAAVLKCLREIDPEDILPRNDKDANKAEVLAGRLVEAETEVEKLKDRLQARYSDAVADVLERREEERKALTEQLTEARQEAASPADKALGECKTLAEALTVAPDAEEARVRLRAALRRIVEGVWCVFVARGTVRIAAVQVWFAGAAQRSYLIVHRAGTGGAVGVRASSWSVESLAAPGVPGKLDLRQQTHAARLESALLKIPAADLTTATT